MLILSVSLGASVNDTISSDLSTLHYIEVSQAAALISKCGTSTLIAKLDLHSACRKVPAHMRPEDQHFLESAGRANIRGPSSSLQFALYAEDFHRCRRWTGLSGPLTCEEVRN